MIMTQKEMIFVLKNNSTFYISTLHFYYITQKVYGHMLGCTPICTHECSSSTVPVRVADYRYYTSTV